MRSFLRTIAFVACLLYLAQPLFAQNSLNIPYSKAAANFVQTRSPGHQLVLQAISIDSEGSTIAYVYKLLPRGFIIISTDTNLHPVYAYSFDNETDKDSNHSELWTDLIRSDLSLRIAAKSMIPPNERISITQEWRSLLKGEKSDIKFQQWPPAGSTSTGGWIETNWTQSAPYNSMCPMDLNAGNRSIAGCPAVAMAQILNYLQKINGTRFSDADDYFHNYGSGNQYTIDDDSASRSFPGFGTLNLYLDSIGMLYDVKANLPNSLKAALVFSCGVAATQVYSASGSGTFGIDQAADAYQRFGFDSSRLVYPADTNLNHDLAENIKAAHPAHLGVVNSGMTAGHNVVVDGYNTDEFFHFNFGWGGSYNGWYTMPPSSMPYSLNYIEGVVLDIVADSAVQQVISYISESGMMVYPNPATEYVMLQFYQPCDAAGIEIYDLYGRIVKKQMITDSDHAMISLTGIIPGVYFIRFDNAQGRSKTFKVLKY